MKRRNTQKSDNLFLYSKLVKEGFDISTLLKFSNKQLVSLASRVLKEAETAVVTTLTPQEVSDPDGVKVDDFTGEIKSMDDGGIELKKQEVSEDTEELTKDNKPIVPVQKVDDEGQVSDQEILEKSKNEFDMYETIMYGGAGDFDATSFYNPDAGGFSTSQGPADSYYSTDNVENLIGAGTGQDEGQYTGNAKYLDTPSFHNPDASGFDSEGPRDSYGQYDSYEGGFAGELNEIGGAPEPRYSFRNPVESGHQSKGPRSHSNGLHENLPQEIYELESEEEIDVGDASKGIYTQTPSQQQAPDGMGDDGPEEKGSRGMGMLENIYEEELTEKFASKAQQSYMYANEPEAAEKLASKMTKKDYEKLPQKVKKESVDRGVVENWLMELVEKYERPSMTKEQLLQTINEIAMMDAPAPVRTPTRTKPGTKPGKPDRKSPYKPKHKPNPKAEDADSDIEDAKYELPAWMDFDTLFIKNEEI